MFVRGVKAVFSSGGKFIIFSFTVYLAFFIAARGAKDMDLLELPGSGAYMYAAFLIPVMTIFVFGGISEQAAEEKLSEIHFTNKAGAGPRLMKRKRDEKDSRILVSHYHSVGIPLAVWLARREEIESALDCSIISIREGADSKQEIITRSIDSRYAIPDFIEWSDEHIKSEDFVLSLGEGLLGEITVDLAKLPHAVIGGTTGSGKSVVLRTLLWQSIVKGARIYIVDFKGGVEFDKRWEDYAEVVTQKERALDILKELTCEMWKRLMLFRKEGCKNIGEHNRCHGDLQLCRVVLACDELAEMLDKDGITDKTEKDLMGELEREMSTLARLSRAAGIHMLLGMQRPDARVLKGQIKNNSPVRICGRAEPVLSEIVLGDPKASQIANEQIGRFYCNIGGLTAFQGYWFEDEKVLKGSGWQRGVMLTEGGYAKGEAYEERRKT